MHNPTPDRRKFQFALLWTAYEYLLIITPVALYVYLVSLHHLYAFCEFIHSPEWNIATIFLASQGQSIYRTELEESQRSMSRPVMGLIGLFVLLVIVFAVANIQSSFIRPSTTVTTLMWVLFSLASLIFFSFLTGAKLVSLAERGQHGQ